MPACLTPDLELSEVKMTGKEACSVLNRLEIIVRTRGYDYRVLIGDNLLAETGLPLHSISPPGRALLVSDQNVFSHCGERVMCSLAAEKWQVKTALIKPGESSKTLAGAKRLYNACFESRLDRNSPVIALGGGVVGDLAGFTAATYMRGVPLVMLPTSLLAQVDSSVGGKVAVNHPLGKNMIGTIYPPRLVIIDPLVLKTLSPRQFQAGAAEVLKYGIIEDNEFFLWLENNLDLLLDLEPRALADAIAASVRSKARVVEKDEYEQDFRRILNFGHTIGHALEAATSFRYYLHGEAVLIGMKLAVTLAQKLSCLDAESADRISRLLDRLKMKKPPAGLTAVKVIDKLEHDKKRQSEDLYFVLPDRIGSAVIVPVKNKKMITDVVESYLAGNC